MAIIPGLPKIPFILIAGALWIAATRSKGRNETEVIELAAGEAAAAAPVSKATPEAIASDMRVDPIELEIATGLMELVDAARGGDRKSDVQGTSVTVSVDPVGRRTIKKKIN